MSEGTRARRRIRTYHEVEGADRSDLVAQLGAQREQVSARLASVGRVVAVMSGKGGVGKSFVTAGLAAALAGDERGVGVLDGDLHGPTTARMLGVRPGGLAVGEHGVDPATGSRGVRVMSSDLILDDEAPLRWCGPGGGRSLWRGGFESGMLREFLAHVRWGELDTLLVDLPPGTERFDSLVELVPGLTGVVVVTVPSEASYRSVRRAVEAVRAAEVPVLGVVENMSGYRCAGCGDTRPLFAGDAGERLARETDAPLLARVPFDPALRAVDDGELEGVAEALAPVADALRVLRSEEEAP